MLIPAVLVMDRSSLVFTPNASLEFSLDGNICKTSLRVSNSSEEKIIVKIKTAKTGKNSVIVSKPSILLLQPGEEKIIDSRL